MDPAEYKLRRTMAQAKSTVTRNRALLSRRRQNCNLRYVDQEEAALARQLQDSVERYEALEQQLQQLQNQQQHQQQHQQQQQEDAWDGIPEYVRQQRNEQHQSSEAQRWDDSLPEYVLKQRQQLNESFSSLSVSPQQTPPRAPQTPPRASYSPRAGSAQTPPRAALSSPPKKKQLLEQPLRWAVMLLNYDQRIRKLGGPDVLFRR